MFHAHHKTCITCCLVVTNRASQELRCGPEKCVQGKVGLGQAGRNVGCQALTYISPNWAKYIPQARQNILLARSQPGFGVPSGKLGYHGNFNKWMSLLCGPTYVLGAWPKSGYMSARIQPWFTATTTTQVKGLGYQFKIYGEGDIDSLHEAKVMVGMYY